MMDTLIERVGEAKTLSLLLSLMLSKMRLAIPKYSTIFKVMAMFKYNALSKLELSLILASFPLLIDYSLVKLINEKTIKVEEDR